MAIRIRIYPQPGSIGMRRRRAMQQQRQQLQQQQIQLQHQQQLIRQQQIQHAGFGGFGMQSGYGFGTGYGFGGANYGASYASPSVGQYSYGSQSPFASSWGVTQASPYGAYAPVANGYGPGYGSGYGFGSSPFLGASYLGASAYATC